MAGFLLVAEGPDGNTHPLKLNSSGQLVVDVGGADITLSVDKTGLATSANQTTELSSLSSIDGKLSSQATSALQTSGNASLTSIDGKLPAAAAPADAASNAENATSIRARLSGFNGTTWDRLRQGVAGAVSSVTGWLNTLPAGQYLAAGVTLTDTQWTTLLTTISGFLKVSLGDEIAGEDRTNQRLRVYSPNSYTHLAANGTTTIKSGSGQLKSITVNTKGASSNVATVYDNTAGSGTVIAVLDTTAGVGTLNYDVAFGTGLTVALATGTSADITVSWW